jgi:hypothetical protein
MTRLRTFANLWTLWDHPKAGAAEWRLPEKIAALVKAGFDGVMGEPGSGIGGLAAANGLRYIAFQRLDGRQDYGDVLKRCQDEGAVVLQVHLGRHDTPLETSLELALRLDEASKTTGLEAVIETHRDTCTETPEKTALLQAQFRTATGGRELPLLLDFSHHAVVKHLDPPFGPRLLADSALVRRTRWHHFRPFNGHHAQIPVTTSSGEIAPEMADWLNFAGEIMDLLREGQQPEVWICPEVGPIRGGYGLSAFPPSWDQAVVLHALIRKLWFSSSPGSAA